MKISESDKEVIVYLGVTLGSDYDPSTGQFCNVRKLYKPGKSKNGWNIRKEGYRVDKNFCLLNIRRGDRENFFLKYLSQYGVMVKGSNEYFANASNEIEGAYRSFVFSDEAARWLNKRIVDNINKNDLIVPTSLVQEIKNHFREFPGNQSIWDKKRCTNLLSNLFGTLKNYSNPFLPGVQMSRGIGTYKFGENYIDTRETRFINVTFNGEYTKRTIKMDLFPCLEDNVLYNEKERNLGTEDIKVDICSPDNPYPAHFLSNIRALKGGFEEGKKAWEIKNPSTSRWYFSEVELNPFSRDYYPAIVDSEKILGLDGLSIMTMVYGSEYLCKLINKSIANLSEII